jgi:hypothetical protein
MAKRMRQLDTIEQARRIAGDGYTKNVLALIKNGIPFDVAFNLEWPEIIGWLVIFGEIEGQKFNWSTMKWIEK